MIKPFGRSEVLRAKRSNRSQCLVISKSGDQVISTPSHLAALRVSLLSKFRALSECDASGGMIPNFEP